MREEDKTEMELIDVAQTIGGIASMSGWASAGIARRVEAIGKPVHEFTVRELLDLVASYDEYARRVFGRGVL